MLVRRSYHVSAWVKMSSPNASAIYPPSASCVTLKTISLFMVFNLPDPRIWTNNSNAGEGPATQDSHHEATKEKRGRVIKKLRALRAFAVQQIFLLCLSVRKALTVFSVPPCLCVRNNLFFIAVAGWSGTHAEHREGQASACPAIARFMSSGWTARPPSLPAKAGQAFLPVIGCRRHSRHRRL